MSDDFDDDNKDDEIEDIILYLSEDEEDNYDEWGERKNKVDIPTSEILNEDDEENNENIGELDVDETHINEPKIENLRAEKQDEKISMHQMTMYEHSRIVGSLASFINIPGFKVHPKVFEKAKEKGIKNLDASLDIAELWLNNCKEIPLPILIKRVFPDSSYEIFHPMELLLPWEIETNYENDDELNEKRKETIKRIKREIKNLLNSGSESAKVVSL